MTPCRQYLLFLLSMSIDDDENTELVRRQLRLDLHARVWGENDDNAMYPPRKQAGKGSTPLDRAKRPDWLNKPSGEIQIERNDS